MTMDLKQYRQMDLILLSVLALITEIMGFYLHDAFPGVLYYLSFGVLIAVIAVIRWGAMGSVVYIVAGLPMVFLADNGVLVNILMYPVANSFILLAALLIAKRYRQKIIDDSVYLLFYLVVTFAVLALGKGSMIFILGESFVGSTLMYFISQLFNLVMTFVILVLLKKRQGLLEDMKQYFERMNVEET